MPTLPKNNACEALRCKAPRLQGSAFCEAHGGKPKLKAARLESNAAYKTAAWQSIRAAQLSKQPLCQSCKLSGRIEAAAHVDHVIPWQAIGPHAFRSNLFQSLCAPCHSVKTSLEARGIFRHYLESGAIDRSALDYPRFFSK